jgi:hypothetical protein
MLQHVAQRHAMPGPGQPRQPPPDGVREPQFSLADQTERDGPVEGLGEAGQPLVITDRQGPGMGQAGGACLVDGAAVAMLDDDDDPGRPGRHSHQLVQGPLERCSGSG